MRTCCIMNCFLTHFEKQYLISNLNILAFFAINYFKLRIVVGLNEKTDRKPQEAVSTLMKCMRIFVGKKVPLSVSNSNVSSTVHTEVAFKTRSFFGQHGESM